MHGMATIMTNDLEIAEAHVAAEEREHDHARQSDEGTDAAAEIRVFRIPACRFADLESKVARLARRAAKMGVPAPSLTKVGTDKVPVYSRADDGPRDSRIIGYLEIVLVTVSGESPKFGGWTFLARLERLPGTDAKANIIHKIVDTRELPAEIRSCAIKCDHCKTKRTRKDTFVVGHEDGRVLQVGSSCLADFLGHASPESLAAQCSYLIELRGALDEDEEWGRGCSTPDAFPLDNYLAWVSVAIRTCGGWLSRSAAYERGCTKQSTASVAWHLMTMSDLQRREEEIEPPTHEDAERGRLATEWGKAVESTNDYLHNLHTIAETGLVSRRSAGLAASLLPAYDRELAREAERKARAARTVLNEYFGSMGERLRGLKLECVLCRDIASDFGEKHLIGFEDAEGRSFKWWSTKGRLDVGVTYTVTGTVKKHDEYKGRKATTLSRCDAATDEELLEREARVEAERVKAEEKKATWKLFRAELLESGEAIEVAACDLRTGMFLVEDFQKNEQESSPQAGPLFSVIVLTDDGTDAGRPKQIAVTREPFSHPHLYGMAQSKKFAPGKKVLVRVVGPAKPEVLL